MDIGALFESVASGVLLIDPYTHVIVDANPAASEMIGMPREAIVGQPCQERICPARIGECPVTDLGQELRAEECYLCASGGRKITVLKSVVPLVLEGRELLLESFLDIGPTRRLEEAYRQSEETLRALMGVPVWSMAIVDPEGTILAVNETGARVFCASPEELIGARLRELQNDEAAERHRRRLEQVSSTGEPLRYEDRDEGAAHEGWMFPLTGPSGAVDRVLVISQDVTERKSFEEAQKKDRDFISKVINTADALVIVRERQGRIVLFNKTAEEVTGYRAGEVAGARVWDLFLDHDQAEHSGVVFRKLLAGERPRSYEELWKTKSGGRRLLALSNATLRDERGSVEYVITTATDITESRLAEEKLRDSEERYRAVFESTGTAMCIIDYVGIIMFMNHEFARISGHGTEEVIDKKNFTDFLTGEGADSFSEHLRSIRETGHREPIRFECTLRNKDGETLSMLANMGFMPGLDSSAVSLIDITREKEYEQDLRQTAERLRDFLVVASHELRHPISIVKGYADTLTEYMDKMPKELVKEILKDVNTSTVRLTRYVEQLLDISRIEQGRVVVERESVDPEQLLETAVEDMKVMGSEHEFVIRITDGISNIDVDPAKFVQLVNILLDNAGKFSPAGSSIEIEAERDRDILVVSVLDRGKGIPEVARELVFDRFYQVEEAAHHSKEGLGLGLYIARQIAEAHGGDIWYEPRKGGGSIFRFTVRTGRNEDHKQP
jgi:PAS domain S-box-containing protein